MTSAKKKKSCRDCDYRYKTLGGIWCDNPKNSPTPVRLNDQCGCSEYTPASLRREI